MALIVDSLNRVARLCSITAPSDWTTATDDNSVELRDDFLIQTVEDILERVDLPSPVGAQTTITGTGAETYSLPANFLRLQRDELAVYDAALDRPCIPIVEDGLWTYIKDVGTAGAIRYFRTSGYDGNWEISFYDEPTSAATITVSYVTKNWMANSGGTAGSAFTALTDVLLLPNRLVEAGTVWRFRERKGLPFESRYNEYEILLARMSNDRRTRRKVNMGGPDKPVRWQDLVPSFIPPN